jgi:hypothetical protein
MRVPAKVCKLTIIQYWITRVLWERGWARTLLWWVISFGRCSAYLEQKYLDWPRIKIKTITPFILFFSFLSMFREFFFLQLICWMTAARTKSRYDELNPPWKRSTTDQLLRYKQETLVIFSPSVWCRILVAFCHRRSKLSSILCSHVSIMTKMIQKFEWLLRGLQISRQTSGVRES